MPEDVRVGKTPAAKRKSRGLRRSRRLEHDIESVTAKMERRNRELAETNQTLSLLRTIDALALESHASLKLVCEHIAQAIVQANGYPLVALFARAGHAEEGLRLYGCSGQDYLGADMPLGGLAHVHLDLSYPWLAGSEPKRLVNLEALTPAELAKAIGRSEAEVGRFLRHLPLKTAYIMKLSVRRRLVGLLVIGFESAAGQQAENELVLVDRLSDSIGVALDNKLLFEENRRVLRQLRESNAKLRALDEAKDDFVSMASHQLRTPLTSIKGYISLVLDGDTGKISAQQRKLLQQAFSGSQRMVYLIADLLNVSRLRTGKFTIEPSPVNLAEVVSQELEQLKEEAAIRKLKLVYKPPKQFPTLMLDETKLRQIIMNFTDNAIYYSPPGKAITVELEEKPATVELRISDHGIGVPKSEQPHLFTKFYRASNARKARPDGTGLGLFMAKKVIVAQGGSLVFHSQEGQGSTFGFLFSKAKLTPPDTKP